MGRRATWLLIVAVACLAAVAVADAVRDSDAGGRQGGAVTTMERAVPLQAPAGAGLQGVLYYTDANCVLRARRFPDLRPVPPEEPWTDCDFAISPRAGAAAAESSRWAPDELTVAHERDGIITVASTATNAFTFAGTAPAFRPDGQLTFTGPEGVRALDVDCARGLFAPDEDEAMIARCSELVLRASDLRKAVYLDANAPDEPHLLRRVAVRGLAWFDTRHPVVLVRATFRRFPPGVEAIAFFEDRRVRAISRAFGLAPDLELSPLRNYVTAYSRSGDGIVVLDRDARAAALPTLPQAHRAAWSPDERWLAVATRASVYIVRVGDPSARIRRVRLVASDLAWRAN